MPIDKLQSLAQCRIKTVYLSHGTVVDRIGWDDVDLIGIVFDAVEDSFSKRTIITAKLIVPTAGVILGTEDRGGFLPPSVQQFQDVMLFRLCRFQQEPFINDEKDGVGILSLNLLVSAIATSYIKLEEAYPASERTVSYSAVYRLPCQMRRPCKSYRFRWPL